MFDIELGHCWHLARASLAPPSSAHGLRSRLLSCSFRHGMVPLKDFALLFGFDSEDSGVIEAV